MQYTLRNIPREVDRALRERARREGRSLNEVAVDAIAEALGLSDRRIKYRDLGDFVGSWEDDPDAERAFADQRRIDEALWR
jgi:hypothetical protein